MSHRSTLFTTAIFTVVTAAYVFDAAALEPDRHFVYVCRDGGNGGYEAFPDVCRIADGRLMCVFYDGWKHVSLPGDAHPGGGRVSAVYSADEGRTWSSPHVVYDGPDDDRDPSVVQLSDGRILCNFFSLKPDSAGGYRGLGSWLVESADGGATWSDPRLIVSDYYCSAPIRVLGDGSLILGLYREDSRDANGAVTRSEDAGTTWSPPIDIDNGGMRLDAETDVIELPGGRLYAAQRTAMESMRYSISSDAGRTWSVSVPIGFPGHCPYLLRTPDGILLLAHRKPATSLHYTVDDGRTWSENVLVDDVGGAYPSMVTMNDGSVLIVYYEEGDGSNIRARKFRASRDGISWIEW
jgi:hypothetical protein